MPVLLQINTVINHGSTSHIVEDIGSAVMEAGWESYIAYGRYKGVSASRTIRVGSMAGVLFHVLVTRLADAHGMASRLATKKLIRQIEKIRPDIIHLHNIHGYYLHIGMLFRFLEKAGIPVVWTLHDCWTVTGHCPHFSTVGCDRWQTQCHHCPRRGAYPASWLVDNSRRNYLKKKYLFTLPRKMVIVPVSDWLAGVVSRSYLNKYPLRRIHNGRDTSVFHCKGIDLRAIREKYGIGDRFMIMGVATRWTDEYGFGDFLELAKRLDQDEVILLVGLSKKQIAKLPGNIIGIEYTHDIRELAGLYCCAGLFFNAAREATFGLVTVEAMSCGTPVMVYDSTACAEVVGPGAGFILPGRDFDHMRQIITRVKSEGKQAWSVAARNHAVAFFDNRDRYKEYLCLYNDILNGSIEWMKK